MLAADRSACLHHLPVTIDRSRRFAAMTGERLVEFSAQDCWICRSKTCILPTLALVEDLDLNVISIAGAMLAPALSTPRET